ncbi:MAG TPA: CBS domain-containing protein [Solirubrobacterales bacterium]
MSETIREVMTRDPATCSAEDTAAEAAKAMRDGDFGAVVVLEGEEVRGILTDRDIVVRGVAEERDPKSIRVGEISTPNPATLSPQDSVERAVEVLREAHVRRLPVVEGKEVVGIVSIGDLAEARDERSALAEISSAPPNN